MFGWKLTTSDSVDAALGTFQLHLRFSPITELASHSQQVTSPIAHSERLLQLVVHRSGTPIFVNPTRAASPAPCNNGRTFARRA